MINPQTAQLKLNIFVQGAGTRAGHKTHLMEYHHDLELVPILLFSLF